MIAATYGDSTGEAWREREPPLMHREEARSAMAENSSATVAVNADTSVDAIRDRATGAMLGLAIGDALGTTLEFRRRDSYEPLTGMAGGGPFNLEIGQWTDDCSMALALADSLYDHPELDEADLMGRFIDWHEEGAYSCTGRCFDIGMTVRGALARFQRCAIPPRARAGRRTAQLMRSMPASRLPRFSPMRSRALRPRRSCSGTANPT